MTDPKNPARTGPPPAHTKTAVHRDLVLASPLAHGADVHALQIAVNRDAKANKLGLKIAEDSQLGPHTKTAVHRVGYAIGLSRSALKAIHAGKIDAKVQRMIRQPAKRGAAIKARHKLRKPIIARRRQNHAKGSAAAVTYAQQHLGVHEDPPYSNGGGIIDTWESAMGVGRVAWCGVFAGYCAKVVGGAAQLTGRVVFTPNIDYDAAHGLNGISHAVAPADAQPGDLVTFKFPGESSYTSDHVGLCVGPSQNGNVHTIDGNTSPTTAGSQFDGGCVAEKMRPFSLVHTVARPIY